MIKAILFDLDGVLADAVLLHQQAFLEAVRPYRYISEEEHMRDLNALPTKKKLAKLGFTGQTSDQIYKNKQERTVELIPKFIKPVANVVKTIEYIKSKGIPFAVCSNSIRLSTELLLKYAGVNGFKFFISNEDVKNPKPDPEMYIEGIKKLGIDKSETLIIEDSPVGLEAAYRSGAMVFRVNNPFELDKLIDFLEQIQPKI